MQRLTAALVLTALLTSGCSETKPVAKPGDKTVDVWADNWFEMHVNGNKVLEDSVPITTERSFNAETATITNALPLTIAVMAKDFKENNSGLEYIGTGRQQMGDGGFIFQIKDAVTGKTVAVSNNAMKCLVVHRAPLDVACAKEKSPIAGQGACTFTETAVPSNWTAPDFDDSAWPAATEHSARAVSPKEGYDRITWDSSAKFVWSSDLVQDNTVLCRVTIKP